MNTQDQNRQGQGQQTGKTEEVKQGQTQTPQTGRTDLDRDTKTTTTPTSNPSTSTPSTEKTSAPQELDMKDQKDVKGGSSVGGSGLDLTNVVSGNVGTSGSASGSHNDDSYSTKDDRSANFGLGQNSSNSSF